MCVCCHRIFDLVNIHLIHDVSNIAAMETVMMLHTCEILCSLINFYSAACVVVQCLSAYHFLLLFGVK